MCNQFIYLKQDLNRVLGKSKLRVFMLPLNRVFYGLLIYRFERFGFLLFGKYYKVIRFIFLPIIFIFQVISNMDIHYKANIKGGINVLHPAMGIVVSGISIIGKNITLTGGNVIGLRKKCKSADFVLGDNCSLGANAVVLGPLILGNNINIGASACVTSNYFSDNISLIGVPAKNTKSNVI